MLLNKQLHLSQLIAGPGGGVHVGVRIRGLCSEVAQDMGAGVGVEGHTQRIQHTHIGTFLKMWHLPFRNLPLKKCPKFRPKLAITKLSTTQILEFPDRGCLYYKLCRKFGKGHPKSSGNSGSEMVSMLSVMVCFEPKSLCSFFGP